MNGTVVHRPPRALSARRGSSSSYLSVELSLGFAALSGLLLWEVVHLPWVFAAPVLIAHVIGGALVLAAIVAPFWLRHRDRLRTSKQPPMRLTGRLIELALLLVGASGLYLFLVGNRGEPIGFVAEQIHLWLTFPLAAGVVVHLARARPRARRALSRTERPVA